VCSNTNDSRREAIATKFAIFEEEIDAAPGPVHRPIALGKHPLASDGDFEAVELLVELVEGVMAFG
jgi:hypothetical protein